MDEYLVIRWVIVRWVNRCNHFQSFCSIDSRSVCPDDAACLYPFGSCLLVPLSLEIAQLWGRWCWSVQQLFRQTCRDGDAQRICLGVWWCLLAACLAYASKANGQTSFRLQGLEECLPSISFLRVGVMERKNPRWPQPKTKAASQSWYLAALGSGKMIEIFELPILIRKWFANTVVLVDIDWYFNRWHKW